MNSKTALKLVDLKVADLKAELDKRGLDKTGIKSVLQERLRNALEEEGKDSEEHIFEYSSEAVTPIRNSKRKNESSEVADDEDMDSGEICDSPEKANEDDDEDTPCSDEDDDDYSKHKEKSDNSRFRGERGKENSSEKVSREETPASLNNSQGTDVSMNDDENQKTEADQSPEAKNKKVLKVLNKVPVVPLTARTLWVTGLASTSKVSDLKTLFSKHGKVTCAKIVRSTKGTQRKWYGLLTLATSKDASKCIEKLHRTELGGHVISVERRQNAPLVKKSDATPVKKVVKDDSASKSDAVSKKTTDSADNEKNKKDVGEDGDKGRSDRDSSPAVSGRYERPFIRGRFGRPFRRPFGFRGRGSPFRGRGRFSSFRRPFGRPHFERSSFRFSRGFNRYEFGRSRGGRLSPREYAREREMRIRRDDDMFRHKIIVRKQREEAYRLEREKDQLRIEREMLEREKAEMLKIERVKQRMEREQLEEEREKLRRQSHGPPMKRPYNRRGGGPPHVWIEKRRENPYEGPSTSFHREKFDDEDKFAYRKSEFSPDFRREKLESAEPKFMNRDERREVTYHGGPDRRVYARNEFRGPPPGPSMPPKHFIPRHKVPRDDWKPFRGDKPGYPPRGHKRMPYY